MPEINGLQSPNLHLIFMLKAPIAGKVKTRLAEQLTPSEANEAYKRMVEYTIEKCQETIAPHNSPINTIEIHYTDKKEIMHSWLGGKFAYYQQANGDLGNRLMAANESSFQRGAQANAFLGGDCPYITTTILHEVCQYLNTHDVILIPAKDGGYVLLATRENESRLFHEIEWGTSKVCRQTIKQIHDCGLKLKVMAPLEDVDELASWKRAKAYMDSHP